jgi:hypothetical protein
VNILFVTPYFYPAKSYGGPLYSIKALAENCCKKNIIITVLTSNIDRDKKIFKKSITIKKYNNLNVLYFDIDFFDIFKKNPFGFFYSTELYKFLRKNIHQYDLVHSHINFNFFSYISLSIAQKNSIPTFFSQRGTYAPNRLRYKKIKKLFFFYFFEKKLVEKSSRLIALNKNEVKYYNLIGFKKKISIVSNAFITTKKIKKNIFNLNQKLINVVFLSRINILKGAKFLINFILNSKQILKNFKFHFAGYDEDSLFKDINFLKKIKKNNIYYYGNLNETKKYSLLKFSDATILPSEGEGQSISILESLFFKNIILTSFVSKFTKGCNFEISFDHNEESLFKALKKLEGLKKNKKLYKIKNSTKKYLLKKFNWKKISKNYLSLARKTIEEHKAYKKNKNLI